MKRLRKCFLSLFGVLTVLAVALSIAACGEKTVKLSFETNGGTAAEAVEVAPGTEVPLPETSQEGYEFDGWYADALFEGEKLSGTVVAPEEDATYYAKWTALPRITLELGGGSYSGSNLYLAEGEDLYAFMQDKIPTKANREFGEWLLDGTPLRAGARMPAGGAALEARWKVPYELDVYKQDAALKTYVKDETLSRTGFDYAGVTIGTDETIRHFVYNAEMSSSVVLQEADENVASAYYDRDVYFITYEANLPAEVEYEGEMPDDLNYSYETEAEILESAYRAEGLRFLGWSTAVDGEVEYLPGAAVPMEQSLRLFAVWDDAPFRDALGGLDYVFLDPEDGAKVYLQRRGLPEQSGVIDENNLFSFQTESFELKGRLNLGKRTFTYLMDGRAGKYIQLDPYISSINYATVFEIEAYDSASISFYNSHTEELEDGSRKQVVDDLILTIDGSYGLDDPDWGAFGIYTFTADETPAEEYAQYASFNFQLGHGTLQSGEAIQFFAIQGAEATNGTMGQYMTLSGTRFTYPVMIVDGFGSVVVYLQAGQEPITNHNYMPANYLRTHADAGDDEFALVVNTVYGVQLDVVARISTELGYTQDDPNPVTVGVWEMQDQLYGKYDYTYETDGGSVTERYVIDGYGKIFYYGAVTTDEEGNESFSLSAPRSGSYTLTSASFYQGASYSDDDGNYEIEINGNSSSFFNTLYVDYDDGASVRLSLISLPGEDMMGVGNGAVRPLDPLAGGYAVANPKQIKSSIDSSVGYLPTQTLYITGLPNGNNTNHVELWGLSQILAPYGSGSSATDVPLSDRIFSGNVAYKGEENGFDVYTITISSTRYSSLYQNGSTVDFYFNEAGEAVFLSDEILFTLAEGGSFKLDGFDVASYTDAAGTTASAEYEMMYVGGGIYTYHFVSGNVEGIFFKFTDGSVHELLQIYEEEGYERNNMWNKSNIRNMAYDYGSLYLFVDGTAFVHVRNTATATMYYLTGTYAEVTGENGATGEYTFTGTAGDTKATNYNNMTFKCNEDLTFTVRSQYYFLTLNGADETSKLVSDGYGNATYTDGTGAQHTGTIHLEFEATNGAIDPSTKAYNRNYNENFYIFTEADGTVWGFIVKRTNGSAGTQANLTTFTVVEGGTKPLGTWWENDEGSVGVTMYYYNGIILYAWRSNNSSMDAWTDELTPVAETEDPTDYTFQLKTTSGTVQQRVYQVSFLTVTANDGVTKWNIMFTYDETMVVDYTVVDDEGNEIGRIYSGGYFGTSYFDAEGFEYDANIDARDETSLSLRYRDERDNVYSLSFDLIEQGGKTVAWVRTAPAFTAWLETRNQLRDRNVYLVADGHGSAKLYTDAASGTFLEGTLEALDDGNTYFRFTSGETVIEIQLVAGVNSAGALVYYYYYVYEGKYVDFYYVAETLESVWLDGYHTATYIDPYGRAYSGEYNVLGKKRGILEFYSSATGYRYFNLSYTDEGMPVTAISALEGAYAYEDNVVYGYQGGAEAPALPEGIDTIASSAFYRSTVERIDLTGVKTIEGYAFSESSRLKAVTGTSSLETIGEYAFYECTALAEIDLSHVKVIESYGMGNTSALASARLDSIEELKEFAFMSNYSLAENVPGGYHPQLTEVHIGRNVKHIATHAFWNLHVLMSYGLTLNVYLHTDADADYDTLITENEVFYQTEMRLYVDSVDVAKAIYQSKMAGLYRSNANYEAYYQCIRVAAEDTSEYGYYIRADYSNTTSTDLKIVRLDGQLSDADGRGASIYPNLCYSIEGETISLVGYNSSSPKEPITKTATLKKENGATKLTVDDTVFVLLGSDPIVYTNGNDRLLITGVGSVQAGGTAFNVTLNGEYLCGDYTYDATLTKTHKTTSRAGYLRMQKTSTYDYQFALKDDLTFDVLLAQDEYEGPNSNQRIKITTTPGTDPTISFSANLSDGVGQLGQNVTTPRVYVEANSLSSTGNYTVESPVIDGNSVTAQVKGKATAIKDFEWTFHFTIDRAAHTYTVKTDLRYGVKNFEGYRSTVYGKDYGFRIVLDSRDGETKMTDFNAMTYRNFDATSAFLNASPITKLNVGENQWIVYTTGSSYKGGFILTYVPAKDGEPEKLEVKEAMHEIYTGTKDEAGANVPEENKYVVGLLTDNDGNAYNLYSFAFYYYPLTSSGEKGTLTLLSSGTGSNLQVEIESTNHLKVTATYSLYKLASSSGSSVTLHYELVYDPEGGTVTVTLKDEIIVRETTVDDTVYRALFVKTEDGTVTLKHFEFKAATASSYSKGTLSNSGAKNEAGNYEATSGSGNSKKTYTITLTDDAMTVTVQ